MPTPKDRPDDASKQTPTLDLNKETLRDLDVEPNDSGDVKGGGLSIFASTGRTAAQSNPNYTH